MLRLLACWAQIHILIYIYTDYRYIFALVPKSTCCYELSGRTRKKYEKKNIIFTSYKCIYEEFDSVDSQRIGFYELAVYQMNLCRKRCAVKFWRLKPWKCSIFVCQVLQLLQLRICFFFVGIFGFAKWIRFCSIFFLCSNEKKKCKGNYKDAISLAKILHKKTFPFLIFEIKSLLGFNLWIVSAVHKST